MKRASRLYGMAGMLLAAGIITALHADALSIMGSVENETGQAIAGATITATFGFGGQARVESATTDAAGEYLINTTFTGGVGGGGAFQLSAAADGYLTQTVMKTVLAPNDGEPDTVVHDFSLVAGQQPSGDSLYVSGVVSGEGHGPLEGALVVVSIVSMTGSQNAEDNTNAEGEYALAMINQSGSRSVVISVSAEGYIAQQAQVQIGNANDGVADVIVRNFTLQPVVYDTLVVIGRIVDTLSGAGLAGARLIVSVGGIGGGTAVLDTLLSDANGDVEGSIAVQNMPAGIAWQALMDGYVSKSGNAAVTGDTARIGTVMLAAYGEQDSVRYTVRGNVSDASGGSLRNIDVTVMIVWGADTIHIDTVTSNMQGNYTTTSPRVAYEAGDMTVTVLVQVEGYAPFSETVDVASSTTDIVMNVVLDPVSVLAPRALLARDIASGRAAWYGLNGRLMGRVGNGEALRKHGRQPVIVDASGEAVRLQVPAAR